MKANEDKQSGASGCSRQTGRYRNSIRTLTVKLAQSGWGRVALHLFIAAKTGHYLWHLNGIAREIVRH